MTGLRVLCFCFLLNSIFPFSVRASTVRIKKVASYSQEQLERSRRFLKMRHFKAESSLDYFRVIYPTPHVDGKAVLASGLLILSSPRPESCALLSLQHSTQVERSWAPSRVMMHGETVAFSVAAAQGYCVVAADYLGLGQSLGVHPYLHAATEASSTADLLKAVKPLLSQKGVSWDGRLFLAGYSQGGHATLALLKALEAAGEPVTAAAGMAGPYDLAQSTVRGIAQRSHRFGTLFTAYLLFSMQHYFKVFPQGLAVFEEPFGSQLPQLFDGFNGFGKLLKTLPKEVGGLLSEQTLAEIVAPEHALMKVLRQNSVYQWVAQSPLLLIHSAGDQVVPLENALVLQNYMQARGAQVKLEELGPDLDHASSFVPAFEAAMQWFKKF